MDNRNRDPVVLHLYTVAYSAITLSRGWFSHLAQSGYSNVIATSTHYGGLAALSDIRGVHRVVNIPFSRHLDPRSDIRAMVALLRLIREVRPDLIHANSPKASFIAALATLLYRRRIPLLYMVRGLPIQSMSGLRRALAKLIERVTVMVAHSTVYVSASLAEAASLESVLAPRPSVLGRGSSNGVNVTRFHPPSTACAEAARRTLDIPTDSWVLGFVGRLTKDKGIQFLRTLWDDYLMCDPSNHLLVVGGEDADFPLDAETADWLRTDPRVTWLGFVDDTRPAYACMDVLLLPTRREGLPNVILEASAMGCPCVASDVTGCRDAVDHGITGFLAGETLVDWIDALESVRSDSPALGDRARAFVLHHFEQSQVWERLDAHYASLIGRGLTEPSR